MKLSFPKVGYGSRASLVDPLDTVGMKAAFRPDVDFSGTPNLRVNISDVIHQANIKVSEGGTIAAAAAAVVITYGPALPALDSDRPFLYAIVDAPTGQNLFLVRVLDPTK